MRRAPALAGTFFNNWANYGFKETVRQTRQWVRGARSGEAAAGEIEGSWKGLGAAPTTTWITLEDWLYAESAGQPEPLVMDGPPSRVLFIAPPFGKGSGGHWDIMRLIAALQAGGAHVELRIYLADGRVDLTEQRELIRDHFPITTVACDLWSRNEMAPTDAVVATGWNTAFAALNCRAGRKIYMVQDYEPWFYSVGTDSILADMTYDFGFDILAAGDWLPTKLSDRNIGPVATFPLGFDSQVYRSHSPWEARTGVLFYLRPATPRRAWEYGAEALRIFHARHPEAPIHLVGGRTNLRMPFPATIHDVMTPGELAALYNTCRVGLAISLSNTSLLPVEMLACGTEVVCNDSEANRANLGSALGVTLAEMRINELASALDAAYTTPLDPDELAGNVTARSWNHAFDEAVGFILGTDNISGPESDGVALAPSTRSASDYSAMHWGKAMSNDGSSHALGRREVVYSEHMSASIEDVPTPDIDRDPFFLEVFSKSRNLTMTSKDTMYALYQAAGHVVEHEVPGDFVECGVWKGGSALLAGLTFQGLGDPRLLRLYDTFQGMTQPSEFDIDVTGQSAQSYLNTYADAKGWCYASAEQVRSDLLAGGLDRETFRLCIGDVAKTLTTDLPERISILRLDTDWYESTRLELETLYPRLVPGGVLIVDDYGHRQGSRKAVDEYFSDKPSPLLSRVNYAVRLGIKP